jgi:hypothetical protein
MRLACVRERQDGAHPCSQISTVDQIGDVRQVLGCDVDQKEGGVDAMALCKVLIRRGLPPLSFPGCPERWWGDEALKAETDAPQATLEQ